MITAQIIIGFLMNVLMGFSLGMLYSLYKLRKISKKTKKFMNEIDEAMKAERQSLQDGKEVDESSVVAVRNIAEKLQYVSGRLDAIGEFYDYKFENR